MARYEAGDQAAARAIHERYAERLIGVARRMLADKLAARVDPDDVVQSAYRSFFMKARDGRFSLAKSGDLWRLLLAITRHKVLHEAERQTAAKRSPGQEEFVADVKDDDAAAEDVVAVADELRAIMADLAPAERSLLELRLREESVETIAAQLEKSPRTVRRMLLELRRTLERRLGAAASDLAHSRSPAPLIDRQVRLDYRDFQLEQMVGAGTFGKVYRAHWAAGHAIVAVKSLRKQFLLNSRAIESFLHEAGTIEQLKHPGIIRSHGLGRTPAGGYFLVLDWHSGGDLASHPSFSPSQAANYVAQAAEAVMHAHRQGAIHCDLKPSNLLLSATGRIVVSDFGFAYAVGRTGQVHIGGTAGFIAPELMRGDRPSPASDVFSLGRVLEWLLARSNGADEDLARRLQNLVEQSSARDPTNRLPITALLEILQRAA